jgi:hypothetical protein
MRTAIFSLLLLAAPGLLAQSADSLTLSPGAPRPSPPDKLTIIMPRAQDWWAQQPNSSVRVPLLAQNQPFAFAVPSPQTRSGKMEPIPTQWPNAKFEAIPTRWKNLKVVPAGGADAASTPGNPSAGLFLQPGRK